MLLLIPGFVTDVIGLLLFIPPVRDAAWRFLKRRVVVSGSFSAGFGGFRGARTVIQRRSISTPKTISRTPDPKSPWRIGADD